MKIRIKGDTIRLRLSQSEVATIGQSGTVSEITHFGTGALTYRLMCHDQGDDIISSCVDHVITISISKKLAAIWATSDMVGMDTSRENVPYILIEKDFQCLTVREGEDETDLYQNPNTTC